MKRRCPFPDTPGLEPTLSELLNDPVMHTLLAFDGLTVADVRGVIAKWHQSYQSTRLNAVLTA